MDKERYGIMKTMKKWMMTIFAVTMMATNAWAGSVDEIRWSYYSLAEDAYLWGNSGGTVYLFALGDQWYDVFGDDCFNYSTKTLISKDGTDFSLTDMIVLDKPVWNNTSTTEGETFANFKSVVNINQWWAIVIVNDDTPDRFDVDVWEIHGIDSEGASAAFWQRALFGESYPFLEPGIGHYYELSSLPHRMRTYGFDVSMDPTRYGAIPEPLTTGLALAGVALLIAQRRRK